jgi:transposase
MNIHKNARLTGHSRADLVRRVTIEGQMVKAVAAAFGVTIKTVGKWVARYRSEGLAGLADRSSRPHRLYRPTPAAIVEQVEALRRQRWTGRQIAAEVAVSPSRRRPSAVSSGVSASTESQRWNQPSRSVATSASIPVS